MLTVCAYRWTLMAARYRAATPNSHSQRRASLSTRAAMAAAPHSPARLMGEVRCIDNTQSLQIKLAQSSELGG